VSRAVELVAAMDQAATALFHERRAHYAPRPVVYPSLAEAARHISGSQRQFMAIHCDPMYSADEQEQPWLFYVEQNDERLVVTRQWRPGHRIDLTAYRADLNEAKANARALVLAADDYKLDDIRPYDEAREVCRDRMLKLLATDPYIVLSVFGG
jgi:hypothetical protein